MNKIFHQIFPLGLLMLLLISGSALAAVVKGTVYNAELEAGNNVLIKVDSLPPQQFLAKDGFYQLTLPLGEYTLTAQRADLVVRERIKIIEEGEYLFDLFLIPDLSEEEELWEATEENLFVEEKTLRWWAYLLGGAILALALYRIIKARKKHGLLPSFFQALVRRRRGGGLSEVKEEKLVLGEESGADYLAEAFGIIRKHGGRITQKELRQEMLYLSEAKVSLLVTELEHKGKIEKIKKGRGNVLILKGAS